MQLELELERVPAWNGSMNLKKNKALPAKESPPDSEKGDEEGKTNYSLRGEK